MSNRSCPIIIFEGPDGAGKSTAISQFTKTLAPDSYHVVHHGPYKGVTSSDDLARLYQESMMPAVLGHRTVILDRCWLSEQPYGRAYRDGKDRLGEVNRRHLERLALRCGATIVRCLPSWGTVRQNFLSRVGDEMLDRVEQLREVWRWYQGPMFLNTALDVVSYDYTREKIHDVMSSVTHNMPSQAHVDHSGTTNDDACVLLVGDVYGERKNGDPLYQWPFSSFVSQGCSHWLTKRLIEANISERHLAWVNSNELKRFIETESLKQFDRIIALGDKAQRALAPVTLTFRHANHPQHAKRFHHNESYKLIDLIKEVL